VKKFILAKGTMVFATGSLGEIGIAPGHTPLLTGLAPGPVRVQNGDDEKTFFARVDSLKYSLI
jgi:F-type H+-transporting ATPase subunit epsilon